MTPRHLDTHRERYPQPVQRAMALLDRVSEGQAVDTLEIVRALRLTGDLRQFSQASRTFTRGAQ